MPAESAPKSKLRLRLCRTLVALFVVLGIGYIYQEVAESLDRQRYPPPGRLVDIGGTRIHLFCQGHGDPTVIAEAGAGSSSLSWNSVRSAVARVTRVCVYDRAGFGWSDYQDVLPTRAQILANLSETLAAANEEGPYILVGHSVGGIYVRDFYRRNPTDVAGMVLVDSSHEQQLAHMPDKLRDMQASSTYWAGMAMPVCHVATAVGLVRAFRVWTFLSPPVSEPTRGPYLMARNRKSFCPAMRGALVTVSDKLNQERGPRSLGDLPLIVLSHGQRDVGTEAEEEWEEKWSTLQRELAGLSSDSTLRVVAGAGHGIQFDRPDAVIRAITEVVQRTR